VIRLRINDPRQIADAVVVGLAVVGEMASDHDFAFGPMDDTELARDLTIFVDGADEVEAAEVLGQRLITAGIAFDGID